MDKKDIKKEDLVLEEEEEEEEDVYDSKNVDEMLEDDEIEPNEAAFMQGYDKEDEKSKEKKSEEE